VEIYEQLARENFAAYAPDLALSLNNLSVRLAESGERASGLAASRRAVEIHEQLVRENFAAFAPKLAASLNNLSEHLANSGDSALAIAVVERAIDLIRPFASQGTESHDWYAAMQEHLRGLKGQN
jgi:hypothetical protein